MTKGISANGEIEGEVAKDKNTKMVVGQEYEEIRNLITFAKKDTSTGSLEWLIANVDPKKGLTGAVIDGKDYKGGRLGT